MAIKRSFLASALLGLTLVTSGVTLASEVEAKGFKDIYFEKTTLAKAKKFKKADVPFKKKSSFSKRRAVRRYGKSKFDKKFFLKK